MACSSWKRNSARDRANCVLPTPVGPKNIKLPMGRFGSWSPALARLIEFETNRTASTCPITCRCKTSSISSNLCFSDCSILSTGIPVQRDTTRDISSSPTSSFNSFSVWSVFSKDSSSFCNSSSRRGKVPYFNSAAFSSCPSLSAPSLSSVALCIFSFNALFSSIIFFSYFHCSFKTEYFSLISRISISNASNLLTDSLSFSFLKASRSISNWVIFLWYLSISAGIESICIFKNEAASSIKSIALSGRNLSDM